jgi:hypothetical protein
VTGQAEDMLLKPIPPITSPIIFGHDVKRCSMGSNENEIVDGARENRI